MFRLGQHLSPVFIMIVCVMQESVFAIVIVFFFLLPLDAVSAQKGFAVNRAFDGIFLALFIEKYVAA